MSQIHVERIIGLLATDEGLRRRFTEDPAATLKRLVEGGLELNWCERMSLARLDPRELARFAQVIDGRLQKIDLERGDT
jgi:hypothetical protein